MKKEYYKLVRDKIPEIMIKEGSLVKAEIIEDDKLYKSELLLKLDEEVNKLKSEPNINEIVDILEVLEAYAKINNFKWEDILRIKEEKLKNKGSFDGKIFLLSEDTL